jgi:DNA-binding PadR family transcriptional regulator
MEMYNPYTLLFDHILLALLSPVEIYLWEIYMTPLTPLSLQVLLALADEERHGYAIIKEIARQTQSKLQPGTGALYTSIQRLVEERLIEISHRRPSPEEDDARRRYYRLTVQGRAALAAETARLQELVAVARKKKVVPRFA